MKRIGHVIGGAEVAGVGAQTSPVFAPESGKQTGEVVWATPAELEAALSAAADAARVWGQTPVMRRADVLFRMRHLLDTHRDDIAAAITAEHGKVLSDSLGEVARGVENVEFACGVPHLLKGAFSERVSTDVDVHELRQPLGVVAGITPFNFPFMVPMWMAATAIACGNAFVLKPSERDPSASMLVARLWREAGLPDGAFTVLNGGVDTALALIDHPTVQAVSFVGSTPVARQVYERSAAAGKRVQALGGAKNHLVVMPDADLAAAADAAVSGAFGSAGERCMAVSVVVAVGGIGDRLVEEITTRARAIVTGPGDDPQTGMGPLVTEAHRDKVRGYVDRAADAGADLVLDGRDELSRAGFFLGPTVVDGVSPDMDSYREEIFGPVLAVTRVDTLDEALHLIDVNPFGNGAAIFCRDGAVAHQFSQCVNAGMVGINVPIPVPAAHFSFGGWKGSLFGDSHIYGPEGVHFYTRTKVVTSRWVAASGVDLSFPEEPLMPVAQIDGLDIAYDVYGDSGQPWIITPGGRFTKEVGGLPELAEALVATGRRVVLWDRPNCGASSVVFRGRSESEVQAEALGGLLRHLDLGPAVIAGGSGGARVSLIAAARHPDVVAGLALWWISGGVTGLLQLAGYYCLPAIEAAWDGGMEAVAGMDQWQEVQAKNPANTERILSMDRAEFLEVMDRWAVAYCPCDDALVPGLDDTDVARLDVPILVFRSGASDLSHTRATSEALAEGLPGAELVEPPWGDSEWNERMAAVPETGSLFVRWPLLVPQLTEWADRTVRRSS